MGEGNVCREKTKGTSGAVGALAESVSFDESFEGGGRPRESLDNRTERIEQARAHLLAAAALMKPLGAIFERHGWLIEDLLSHIDESIAESEAVAEKRALFSADFVDSLVKSCDEEEREGIAK